MLRFGLFDLERFRDFLNNIFYLIIRLHPEFDLIAGGLFDYLDVGLMIVIIPLILVICRVFFGIIGGVLGSLHYES